MAFIGLCRISCLITNALQKFWTGAFDHVWSYRQHPVFLLPYEWMLHAIEHDNAWCVGMVNTGAVQQSAIGYNHSACGGVDIDCRGQLANRLVGRASDRVRWLPGMTRVPPLVSSISVMAVSMLTVSGLLESSAMS